MTGRNLTVQSRRRLPFRLSKHIPVVVELLATRRASERKFYDGGLRIFLRAKRGRVHDTDQPSCEDGSSFVKKYCFILALSPRVPSPPFLFTNLILFSVLGDRLWVFPMRHLWRNCLSRGD